MNKAKPKRVRLRTADGGAVIFDAEEQAELRLRLGYPELAIFRLRDGSSIESPTLRAAIAEFMEGTIKRRPNRPRQDMSPIDHGRREADLSKAELVRNTVLPREQAMGKLRRKLEKVRLGKLSPDQAASELPNIVLPSDEEIVKRRRKLRDGEKRDTPVVVANKHAAKTIGKSAAAYKLLRGRKSREK